jgi:tRNA pseudouridine55 synthase
VVARIRKFFGLRKVGHAGTLDPMATGLLVILIGRATKLSEKLMGADKVYEGVMHLGVATDTHDIDGRPVSEADPGDVAEADLRREMAARLGDIMQTPPMVSAIKKDGVPLYKLARKGKTVEREPRLIHVYSFDLLEYQPPRASFRLACTKGTYVRTLCDDIGQALGCGAHLEALRRTRSGALLLADAKPLDRVTECTLDQLRELLIPISRLGQEAAPPA